MLPSWTAFRHSPALTKRLMLACCAGVLMVSLGASAPARAADDDDEAPEISFLKKMFGVTDQGSIDYRERSPLVVPPTRNLPPPEATLTAESNPAWPKDPEKQPKKKKERYSTTDRQVNDSARPISPYDLDKGRKSGAGLSPSAGKDGGERMSPSELGYKGGLWGSLFNGGGEKDEIGKFEGEGPRTSLTAPPTGYMTPSPSQPYGLSAKKEAPKPFKLEDRGTETR
jgi:hypothetical protein